MNLCQADAQIQPESNIRWIEWREKMNTGLCVWNVCVDVNTNAVQWTVFHQIYLVTRCCTQKYTMTFLKNENNKQRQKRVK